MRIARSISPDRAMSRDVFDPRAFAGMRASVRQRAQRDADLKMAANLRRSRALAQKAS